MGTVTPFPLPTGRQPSQIGFERIELTRILDLYGRMVAAGHLGRKSGKGWPTAQILSQEDCWGTNSMLAWALCRM